jgi:hypothetical protein
MNADQNIARNAKIAKDRRMFHLRALDTENGKELIILAMQKLEIRQFDLR